MLELHFSERLWLHINTDRKWVVKVQFRVGPVWRDEAGVIKRVKK